jgi:hypothetical protein
MWWQRHGLIQSLNSPPSDLRSRNDDQFLPAIFTKLTNISAKSIPILQNQFYVSILYLRKSKNVKVKFEHTRLAQPAPCDNVCEKFTGVMGPLLSCLGAKASADPV